MRGGQAEGSTDGFEVLTNSNSLSALISDAVLRRQTQIASNIVPSGLLCIVIFDPPRWLCIVLSLPGSLCICILVVRTGKSSEEFFGRLTDVCGGLWEDKIRF